MCFCEGCSRRRPMTARQITTTCFKYWQELKQSERLQDRSMQSINRNYRGTPYDLWCHIRRQCNCFPCFTGLRIRLQVWPLYKHNTEFLSLFAQLRKTANICTRCISLKTSPWPTILSLAICVYLIVLFRSFVPKRGRRIQWNRRRKQISALTWRVEVIQGQSFYAHWKADKLLHVAA